MKKRFILLLATCFSCFTSAFAQNPEYTSLFGTSNNVFPFQSTTNKVQWIYWPTDITPIPTAGLITKFYIRVNPSTGASGNVSFSNFEIKMGNTTVNATAAGPWHTGLTTVYSAPTLALTTVSNTWVPITLQTPFYYTGGNLLIEGSQSSYVVGINIVNASASHNARMWGTTTGNATGADVNFMYMGFDMVKENDLTVTKLVSPNLNNLCNGIHEFKVRVKNLGIIDVSPFTINWSVDNVVQTPITYNNTIQAFGSVDSIDVKVGDLNMNLNTVYNIKVWSSNPNNTNDPNPMNDTLTFTASATRQGIVLNPLPDTMICKDGQIVIDAGYSINTDYTWSNGVQTQQNVIDQPGTYWLYAYNTEGCALRDTMEVTLNPSPTAAPIIAAIDQGNNEYLFNIPAAQDVTYWEWDFGDGSALEYGPGPKPHRYANQDDTFLVKLKLANECDTITRELNVVHFAKTSTNNIVFDKNIDVYPIPANSVLNLKSKLNHKIDGYEVYNALGELILTDKVNANATIINMKDVAAGNYFIKVNINNQVFTKMFSKIN